MSSKREEIRQFIERESLTAIAGLLAEMSNREQAEAIRVNRSYLVARLSWHFHQEYRFMELADIMEWKRTRVRR